MMLKRRFNPQGRSYLITGENAPFPVATLHKMMDFYCLHHPGTLRVKDADMMKWFKGQGWEVKVK